jgi:hypothetical protein
VAGGNKTQSTKCEGGMKLWITECNGVIPSHVKEIGGNFPAKKGELFTIKIDEEHWKAVINYQLIKGHLLDCISEI